MLTKNKKADAANPYAAAQKPNARLRSRIAAYPNVATEASPSVTSGSKAHPTDRAMWTLLVKETGDVAGTTGAWGTCTTTSLRDLPRFTVLLITSLPSHRAILTPPDRRMSQSVGDRNRAIRLKPDGNHRPLHQATTPSGPRSLMPDGLDRGSPMQSYIGVTRYEEDGPSSPRTTLGPICNPPKGDHLGQIDLLGNQLT